MLYFFLNVRYNLFQIQNTQFLARNDTFLYDTVRFTYNTLLARSDMLLIRYIIIMYAIHASLLGARWSSVFQDFYRRLCVFNVTNFDKLIFNSKAKASYCILIELNWYLRQFFQSHNWMYFFILYFHLL